MPFDNDKTREAEIRRIEREARAQYEAGHDFTKWRRLKLRASFLFSQADRNDNKQVFDFVQRVMTAAIVLAATTYVAFGPGFGREPRNFFAQSAWALALVGLMILSARLALATYIEACRFAGLLVTELAIVLRLRYRPRLRRWLTMIIVLAILAATSLLGVMIGGQALNQTGTQG